MDSFKEFVANADLVPMVTGWGVKIFLALVIYIIGKWVAKRVTAFVGRLMNNRSADPTLVKFLSNVVYAILLTAVILAALDTLGLPITSLVAVVGAAVVLGAAVVGGATVVGRTDVSPPAGASPQAAASISTTNGTMFVMMASILSVASAATTR